MKKIKILIIVIIIITSAIIINCIRNYQIFKKIENAGNNFFNSSNYQITERYNVDDYEYIYHKDNISLIEIYSSREEEIYDFYWEDCSTGEKVFRYQELYAKNGSSCNYEEWIPFIRDLATLKKSNTSLFSIITEKDGCYIINGDEKDWKMSYDKETGLLKKYYEWSNGKIMSERDFTFELNTVTDEILEKPVPISVEEYESI